MHPFSRGSVRINSTDPFAAPLIDPRFLTNPVDVRIMLDAFKYSRHAFGTNALQELSPMEVSPGSTVQTDDDIIDYIREQALSIFHPSGTAAMMPRFNGGVVDNDSKVYGIHNLRVMDASTVPILPGTHLQSTVYAMALKVYGFLYLENSYADISRLPKS